MPGRTASIPMTASLAACATRSPTTPPMPVSSSESGGWCPGEVDLRWVPAILKRNGIVEETGVAAAVLDDPVMGIVWLARRLSGYGITLEAGETILAGSFTRPVDCRAGDHFEVDYADLGVITVDFV